MRKFFSVWLVLLVIAVFAAVLLVSYPVLTTSAQQTALDDLNVLLDAAFTRLSLAEASAKTVADSAADNVLSKARAIDRFLSHDDALLETDALVVLCDLLNVSSIDVTDMDGMIVASSVSARVGGSLITDARTKWTEEVLAGENLSRTRTDESNAALLSGCVSRTDTEGLIYIQSLDVSIMAAATAATPEQVLLDMSFIKDTLVVAEEETSDGGYLSKDAYCVARTQDGVSLIAARPLSQVYAERSAVLLVEAIGFLLCIVFAIVIQTLLIKKRLTSKKAVDPALALGEATASAGEEDGDGSLEETPQLLEEAVYEDSDEAATSLEAELVSERKQMHRKRKGTKPRQKIFEFVEVKEPDTDKAETAASDVEQESAAQEEMDAPAKKPRARRSRKKSGQLPEAETLTQADAEITETPETPAEAIVEEALSAPLRETETVQQEAAEAFSAPLLEEVATATPGRKRRAQSRPETTQPATNAKNTHKRKNAAEPDDSDSAFDKIFD